jgi:adenosylhomocysteine nucleosidase
MIAILISANSEWKAVLDILDPANRLPNPFSEHFFTEVNGESAVFMHGGWGKVSAAASTQFAIDTWKPRLIVNLGTCGGLAGTINVGETLLVNETVVYDIYERMADPEQAIRFYSSQIDLSFINPPYPMPVKTGRLASADQDINPAMVTILREKFGVTAADWESSSIAWVAERNALPCLILRTVSDVVSEQSGEIYNDGAAQFHERCQQIMKNLLDSLPDWLSHIKKEN